MSIRETLRCWSARNLLDLYADRRLTERAGAKVAAHLTRCAECRELAGELGAVTELLAGLGEVKVPEGLAESILAQLGTEPASSRPRVSLLDGLRLKPSQAAALLYIGLLAGGNSLPGPASATASGPRSPAALELPAGEARP